tara:strand:- start:537 stop:1220 length:684 start_codon:yes stop_codon:yes gene_type:complete
MALVFWGIVIGIALSILAETYGVWARVVGAVNNSPTTGYSIHVRIATAGRFFTFMAAPLLGFLVDSGVTAAEISLIGSLSFFLISIATFIFIYSGLGSFNWVYGILDSKYPKELVSKISITFKDAISYRSFVIVNILSFGLSGIGIIVVNIFAALNPDHRATIVQLAASITAVGTLLHVFKIDPQLSRAADSDPELLQRLVMILLISRIICACILGVGFVGFYLWLL